MYSNPSQGRSVAIHFQMAVSISRRTLMFNKCSWADSSEILKKYHDEEWGHPLHDDRKLFEMLNLEGMSCGLSWEIVLKKREYLRNAFDNFNPQKLIAYDDRKIDELMTNSKIIRHRAKILAVVQNAKAYLELTKHQTLDNFLWSYVDNRPIKNETPEIITRNAISDKLSRDLKKLGFKFVGSIIIYSFMQAIGIVNDHDASCLFSKVN